MEKMVVALAVGGVQGRRDPVFVLAELFGGDGRKGVRLGRDRVQDEILGIVALFFTGW